MIFRSWIATEFLPEAAFKNFEMPPEETSSGIAVGLITCFLILVIIGFVIIYFSKKGNLTSLLPLSKPTKVSIIPTNVKYNTFKKDSNLQDALSKAIDVNNLKQEYKSIEAIVKESIDPVVTTNIANAHKEHNRYTDMVPYDDNRVTLETKTGKFEVPH